MTAHMTTNKELENCLTKAIYAYNVRGMLTKLGLPEDAEATMEFQLGDSQESLASCEIPTTVKKDHIPSGSVSLKSFRSLIVDDFINPALNTLDLGSHIPDDDQKFVKGERKMKVVFRSTSDDFAMDMQILYKCCRSCGFQCCSRAC